jgi:hypothetical protein
MHALRCVIDASAVHHPMHETVSVGFRCVIATYWPGLLPMHRPKGVQAGVTGHVMLHRELRSAVAQIL